MVDPEANASLRERWRDKAGDICARARRDRDRNADITPGDADLDGRMVINYEVNVRAFYEDLWRRLDGIQSDLQRARRRSERRLRGGTSS